MDFEVAFAGNGKVINFSGKVLGATDVPVKDIVQLQHRDESRLARAAFIPSQTWNGVDCLWLAERRTAVKNHSSQIQLSQAISGNQVEIVSDILSRGVKIGYVNDWDTSVAFRANARHFHPSEKHRD